VKDGKRHAVPQGDRGRPELSAEQGSFTVFVAVLTLALFSLVGLVIDGGRAVAAQNAAAGEAEQAARLGADQISLQAIRSGIVSIDPASATKAVNSYLQAVGTDGAVTVVGQTVTVHIRSSEPTVILGIIGVEQIGISATASATSLHGVTRPDS
jgi:Flp pilus assembly protein TadG